MVEVGDKVFVAPLYGQKDNLAVIPAGGGGITEGDYNTWTWKWTNKPAGGIADVNYIGLFIDDKNDVLNIAYDMQTTWKNRFCIYALSDFSVVFESLAGVDHTYTEPYSGTYENFKLGFTMFAEGGISRSIQSYVLLMRLDQDTIEVWRGGSSALWTANTQTDFGATSACHSGAISPTGKYIIVIVKGPVGSRDYNLMLYEGSKV